VGSSLRSDYCLTLPNSFVLPLVSTFLFLPLSLLLLLVPVDLALFLESVVELEVLLADRIFQGNVHHAKNGLELSLDDYAGHARLEVKRCHHSDLVQAQKLFEALNLDEFK